MVKRHFPKGSKFTAWYLDTPKADKPRVRREITTPEGKRMTENYPQAKYKHLLSDVAQLQDFVIRLNGKDPRIERVKDRLQFEHAFIGPEFLDQYQNVYLRSFIPSETEAKKLVWYLKHYALNYFIGRLGLANPLDWKKHEARWGVALINKQPKGDVAVFDDGEARSAKVLKLIVYELNRFMRFLHSQHPDLPALTFEPLSRAILKDHEANRKLRGEVRVTNYIPDEHWKKIEAALPADWGCLIKLCYTYGLRRNEAYGLVETDLKKGYLSIERQLDKIVLDTKKYKPSKSRFTRKTPHWFGKLPETHKLIKQIDKLSLHPDSISHLFTDLCSDLNLPHYTVHDLRRSFITNCVRKKIDPEELRLAVGHVDGSTTYKYYVMDARDLEGEVWLPDEAS